MSKDKSTGIHYVAKAYHGAMKVILEERGQTQQEAADELGISLSYFNQIYRLKKIPDFMSPRCEIIKNKFEEWSGGFAIEEIFPPAIFTQKFLASPKTHTKDIPFRLLYGSHRNGDIVLTLPAPQKPNRRK